MKNDLALSASAHLPGDNTVKWLLSLAAVGLGIKAEFQELGTLVNTPER